MHLPAKRSANDFDDVFRSNSAARHDLDAAGGKVDHFTERAGAFKCRRRSAASENSRATDLDQRVHFFSPIGDKVEGAMEYRGTWSGYLDELARPRLINRSTSIENAEHNPNGPQSEESFSVAKHGREFVPVVAKPARARAHHDHNGQRRTLKDGHSQTKRRRQAAEFQAATKFNSLGAGRCCCVDVRDRSDANFNEYV
jgi:hypothetical protein